MARAPLILTALIWAVATPAWAEAPDCPPVEPGAELSGEAAAGVLPSVLLILPKGADGAIVTDGLALAEGTRVAESRFSPLLCATIARIEGPAGASPASLVLALPTGAAAVQDDTYETEADPDVSSAVPTPNAKPDPYRKRQWAHDALEIDAAQRVARGDNVRVAVLDSRVNEKHPDLSGTRVIGEDRGAAAQHGTLVAGIIGARARNGAGIHGVAPAAQLLSLPACEASPRGDVCRLFAVLVGLDAAWSERAQVVNVSLVGPANRALERAVRRLDTLGVAVVAASGNRTSGTPAYPAAYPWVIGVAATDVKRALAPTGSVVDLTAPGVEIVSTAANGGYAFASGSSLAAAHASGALALLTSASGGDLAAARRALFSSATRANPKAPPALPKLCDALAKLGKRCAR
jgi:hypothetical protein